MRIVELPFDVDPVFSPQRSKRKIAGRISALTISKSFQAVSADHHRNLTKPS